MRHHLNTILVAMVTAAVTAGTPAIARSVFADNSDKVDGKHAVSGSTSVAKRKGKLVATSPKSGQLPNNIIKKALDADKLDGKDSSRFALRSSLTAPGTINSLENPVEWRRLKGVPTELIDGDALGPLAFAHVSDAGVVDPSLSSNVAGAEVTHQVAGVYCFDLSFEPKHVIVTSDFEMSGGTTTPATVRPFATLESDPITTNCSSGNALVVMRRENGANVDAPFFVSFM